MKTAWPQREVEKISPLFQTKPNQIKPCIQSVQAYKRLNAHREKSTSSLLLKQGFDAKLSYVKYHEN